MNPLDHTRPERACEIGHARRKLKRMKAKREKHGNCCICRYREITLGVYHCKNRPERQHGVCERDGALPKFVFDDAVLPEFDDAT